MCVYIYIFKNLCIWVLGKLGNEIKRHCMGGLMVYIHVTENLKSESHPFMTWGDLFVAHRIKRKRVLQLLLFRILRNVFQIVEWNYC